MRVLSQHNRKNSTRSRLLSAAGAVLEPMEKRMMMSSTIAAWTFSNYSISTTPNLTPVPTTGSGSAVSVGFQTGSTSTKNTLNPYPYPNASASGSTSGDISDMVESLATAGSTDNAENVSPATSTTAAAWRVRGNSDGWSGNAAIASQGAQFNVSSYGYSGIAVEFDFDPSSGSAPSELLVQYNTNVANAGGWTNASENLSIGTASNGSTAGITVATNTANSNIASGSYFQVANSAQGLLWENNLVASFTGIPGVDNDPNFGVRFVNAATGNAEFEVTGTGATPTAFPAAGAGNWRFNDVRFLAANQLTPAAPTVTGPSNVSVILGSPATFTSSASAYPAVTGIEWLYSTDGGMNFNPAPGTNNTANYTYTPTGSIPATPLQFEVQYTNGVGPTISSPATLTVTIAPPTIVTSPGSLSVANGSPVTLSASANSAVNENVLWYVSTNGGTSFTKIAGSASNVSGGTVTSYMFSAAGTNDQYEYLASFTNPGGTANSSIATLTVTNYAPVVTLQPVSQGITEGQSVTFTAAANENPTGGTVKWQSSSGLTSTFTNINGATSASYTIPDVTDSLEGTCYRAVFTNSVGTTATNPAVLTVFGAPIAQWIFNSTVAETIETNGGESDSTLTTQNAGSADAPLPTLAGPSTGDIAQTLGLFNDYTGIPVFSGADINQVSGKSTINPNFAPYAWRVRSSHLPDGWSQLAPNGVSTTVSSETGDTTLDPQGVQFDVNTVGYQNVTLQFYWNGGGIADMQAQYSPDGGQTWLNVGVGGLTANPAGGVPNLILQNFSKDYPGITPTTTPPPYVVNMSGITAAANNPNLQVRLVAAYDPNLPLVSDGNVYQNPNDPTALHGQYASSNAGAQNEMEVLDLGGDPDERQNFNTGVTGGSFQLSFGSAETPLIQYNPGSFNDSSFVTTIQNDLDALPTIGGIGGNVTVADELITPFTTDSSSDAFLSITFGGALGNQPIAASSLGSIQVVNNQLTGANPTATIATWIPGAGAAGIGSNGYETGVTSFVDGNGGWTISNFSFNGTTYNGAPQVITNPGNQTIVGGTNATFTATEYSETPGTVTAQWQMSTGSSFVNVGSSSTVGATNTSSYTFTSAVNNSNSGDEFRVVFSNSGGSTISFPATLTTVLPVAPMITLQPLPASVQVGFPVEFSATATGSPTPTVYWQVSSGSPTSGFTNLTDGQYVTGSQTDNLQITPQTPGTFYYRAIFGNVVNENVPTTNSGSSNGTGVALTVLADETVITDWDFNQSYSNVTSAKTPDPYVNSPAPYIGTGTASAIGFDIPYNPNDPATGSSGPSQATGSFNADDIVQSPGADNPAYTQNTWRVRGGPNSTTGGAPANGWSIYAAQYSQGAQFSVSTVGYTGVYVTMDWYSTTSGELNARQQYTLDGVNWYNLDDHQLDTVTDPNPPLDAVSNDFYGASATYDSTSITSVSMTGNAGMNTSTASISASNNYQSGETVSIAGVSNALFNGVFTILSANGNGFTYAVAGNNNVSATTQTGTAAASLGGQPIPLVFNLSGISGVADNPNFGIRLVNAYNPTLPLVQLPGESQPEGQYAVASSVADPTPYLGAAGNWRFADIVFHGLVNSPAWLGANSQATWNAGSKILNVYGPTTIIGDPGTDEPMIDASGSAAVVTIDTGSPTTVNIGGLDLTNGASVVMTGTAAPHVLVVAPGSSNFVIDSTSKLDLGVNEIDFQAVTSTQSQAILSTIVPDLTTGYAGGDWSGDGIMSSAARNDAQHLTALGYLLNSNGLYGTSGILGTFDGSNPGTNDVLVRYTYYGDTNLDGQVDGSDYSNIDNSYNTSAAPSWMNGNFNYDSAIDGSDYTLIDNAFNTQDAETLAGIATPAAVPTAQIASVATSPTSKPDKKIGKAQIGKGSGNVAATIPSSENSTASLLDLLKHDQQNVLAVSLLDGLHGLTK